MNLKYFAMLGAAILLTVGCKGEVSSNQPITQAEPSPAKPAAQKSAVKSGQSGNFVKADHDTKGVARIVSENGKRYLELDQAFKTDSGPDLFVLLHRASPPQKYQPQDYANLGRLQKVSGTQRYAIPENVNPADFRSVVIWCRAFNVTFGYAPLRG